MLKIPKTFIEAGSKQTASVAVKARIDMSAEVAGLGLCPECKKPMTKAFASGIPVHICQEHRIAIPVQDEN